MVALDITKAEVESGVMTPEHLRAAVNALREDGFVVLNDVVDTAHLDILHERMMEDLQILQARKDAPFNWNIGNIQQDPPPFPPYLFRDILLNDMAIQVGKAVLGQNFKSTFYSGNTALPSESRQPVHGDTGHLWPELEHAHPAHLLVVNIPTVDVSPENGSTEIWPGSHKDVTLISTHGIELPDEALDARRQQIPPIQPSFKRGGILIRDMRLWHAGMPNRTVNPRPMIALIFNAPFMEVGLPLRFPKGTEKFFAHPDMQTAARFVDEEIDHIYSVGGHKADEAIK